MTKTNKTVVVGIVQKENQFLLVKRNNKNDFPFWVFPGGKKENYDKNEKETLKREILEESSIICSVDKKLGERIHPDTNHKIIYYYCTYKKGKINTNKSIEIDKALWLYPNEIFEKITTDIFEPIKIFLLQKK